MLLFFGLISIILATGILIVSFIRSFHDYALYTADSLRLIAGLLLLGGILTVAGTQMEAIIASYALLLVGISLTATSWFMAYRFRMSKPRRKRKPKHKQSFTNHSR